MQGASKLLNISQQMAQLGQKLKQLLFFLVTVYYCIATTLSSTGTAATSPTAARTTGV